MMQSSPKSYQRGSGNMKGANCIILYKSFSLSRQKKTNWKLSGGRSQENEML